MGYSRTSSSRAICFSDYPLRTQEYVYIHLCVRSKHEGPARQRKDGQQAGLTEYDGVLASRSRHKEHHHLVCIGKGHRRLQPRVHGPEDQQPYPAVTEGISNERSRSHKPSKSARRRDNGKPCLQRRGPILQFKTMSFWQQSAECRASSSRAPPRIVHPTHLVPLFRSVLHAPKKNPGRAVTSHDLPWAQHRASHETIV